MFAILYLVVLPGLIALAWLLGWHNWIKQWARRRGTFGQNVARGAIGLMGPSALFGLTWAYAEIVPLPVVLLGFVIPLHLIIVYLGTLFPTAGRRALIGFTAGVVAVLVYDVMRLVLAYTQGAADPIPHIGTLLTGDPATAAADEWIGYVWRTFGNGAGLGIFFAALPDRFMNAWGGVIYGFAINVCMLIFLTLNPQAQVHLFEAAPVTAINSVFGHLTYGVVLGLMMKKGLNIVPNFATASSVPSPFK